jgi:hypothetical protein
VIAVLLFFLGGRHYNVRQVLGIKQIKEGTSNKAISDTGELDTSGVLEITRHPWYLATILLIWARQMDVSVIFVNVILTFYLIVASFLGFDLSDEKTGSLDDSPDSESTAIVMAPFPLEYTFASTRTQLFLGTDLTDLIRFDYSQQIGVKQGIGTFGILQGGILFSGIPAKVWKDPYVVDRNRDETSRESTGARLTWDRIFGSKPMNFYISSAFVKSDSNIDFYDQEAFMATVGVFFRW